MLRPNNKEKEKKQLCQKVEHVTIESFGITECFPPLQSIPYSLKTKSKSLETFSFHFISLNLSAFLKVLMIAHTACSCKNNIYHQSHTMRSHKFAFACCESHINQFKPIPNMCIYFHAANALRRRCANLNVRFTLTNREFYTHFLLLKWMTSTRSIFKTTMQEPSRKLTIKQSNLKENNKEQRTINDERNSNGCTYRAKCHKCCSHQRRGVSVYLTDASYNLFIRILFRIPWSNMWIWQ